MFSNSKYTIELRHFKTAENLFDFDYNYFDFENKKDFETLFFNCYYFHEIGFETIERFKHALKTKLNSLSGKYKQLYELELKAKNIDYLMNKDLKEEFIKEVNQLNKNTSSGSSENNINAIFDESDINNGLANVDVESSITTTNKSVSDTTNTSTAETVSDIQQIEKNTFTSRGNIGVVSSADLLKQARDVILDLNIELINECNDLFMQIY